MTLKIDLLPLPATCWDCRCVPPFLVLCWGMNPEAELDPSPQTEMFCGWADSFSIDACFGPYHVLRCLEHRLTTLHLLSRTECEDGYGLTEGMPRCVLPCLLTSHDCDVHSNLFALQKKQFGTIKESFDICIVLVNKF